ncbi:glycosyl hydrolase family 18 protein [Paenibacillus sp.]|uniref:glycosyl hydrolase family 18 protein n=1 Tax=Paenibacillus sp. TaxID=58172 RepID=UPI002D45EDA2|nr:glycosyl hydrolase family 18 protein [Paenibacillus sp.]HZG86522.1 glycosyl hydrolase family 18 protein [Paenibacillus sp.]
MLRATVPPPRRRRRGRGWITFLWLTALIALLASAAVYGVRNYVPSDTRIIPDYGTEQPVFYGGVLLEGRAIGSGEAMKLPLPLLAELVDPSIAFEESSQSVIMTTNGRVVRLVSDQLTAWANDKPFQLRFPAERLDDVVYVPIAPLADLYGLQVVEAPDTGIVTLRLPGDVLTYAALPEAADESEAAPAAVREKPSIKAGIMDELRTGERAVVWGEESGWYRIQTDRGHVGYVDKRLVVWSGAETVVDASVPAPAPHVPERPIGEKIVLTWEQVYAKAPDPSTFDPMPGLNVVSPTWFHLLDEEGSLENRADRNYVRWAHERGYQVWALFSNSFDPDMTSEALSTYDRRMTMARQLVAWAQLYELDGINVDFENVYVKDGPKLTQFMRELTPLLHEAGLTVSIDVTFPGGSDTWSKFLDRKALGGIVDYMMVMAYDEHWASSPVAGSVASLPWVEAGVRSIIEQHGVPAEKLVLGIPFYARQWTETTENGKTKVTSKALGMDTVAELIRSKGLTPKLDAATGQNYVEYKEDGAVRKIWLEDETSVRARAALVRELGLAGVASWSRNFASADIWETLRSALYE